MPSTAAPSLNQFAVNRAIDAIKRAEFELNEIDLRSVHTITRPVIKDAREALAKVRKSLNNPFPQEKQ